MFSERCAGNQNDGHRFTVWGLGVLPLDASPATDRAQGGHDQAVGLGGSGLALPAAAPSGNLHLDGGRNERLGVIQAQGFLPGLA